MTKEMLKLANTLEERIRSLEKLLEEKDDIESFMEYIYRKQMYNEVGVGKSAARELKDCMLKVYKELLFTTKQEFERI